MKFRKKPVVVEAFRLPDPLSMEDANMAAGWCEGEASIMKIASGHRVLELHTLEGIMTAYPGDWIVKGIKDEFYPVKPDIFAETYEPVEGE